MKTSEKLMDVQKTLHEHRSFKTLTVEEQKKIKVGDFVTVFSSHEYISISVYQIEGEKLRGVIDSLLTETRKHQLEYGDYIEFEFRHILSIFNT